MNDFSNKNINRNLSIWAEKISIVNLFSIVGIGVLVLVGWQFNIAALKQFISGTISMNPLTAILFICISCSLYIHHYFKQNGNRLFYIGRALVFIICLISSIKLLHHFGIIKNIEIDRLVYSENLDKDLLNGKPNRMAPNTALCFLFASFVLFFYHKKEAISQYISLIIGFIAMLSIIGYIYGVAPFYGISSYTPMAVNTSVCFFLFSLSALFLTCEKGFMAEIFSNYQGGRTARLLLPMVILIPIVLGYCRLYFENIGFYPPAFGTAMFTTLSIVIFVFLIWKTTSSINDFDNKVEIEMMEKTKAKEDLKNAYDEIFDLYNNAPCGYHSLDSNGFFVDINETELKWLGYKKEEVVGKLNFKNIITENSRMVFQNSFPLFKEQGFISNLEFEITRKNGTTFPILLSATAVYDSEGNYLKSRSTLIDYTERKLIKDKLRQFNKELEEKVRERTEELEKSKHSLQKSLEELSNQKYAMDQHSIIAITDLKGDIIYVNDKFCSISGYSREELIGKNHRILKSGYHPREFYEDMYSVICKGEVWNGEICNRAKKGSIYWVQTTIVPFLDKKTGKPIQYVSIRTDVTKRKRDKLELKLLNEQLNLKTEKLTSMVSELEQFTYVASHDLQEPLRMITSFLSQLEKKYQSELDERARQYIFFAVDGATRMRKIILDLLEYSRAGKTAYEFEKIDINELLNHTIQLNSILIKEKKAIIKFNDLPIVIGSRTPLQQVFQNLISNALKYQKKDSIPVIEIKSEDIDSHWKFSVSDNGIGIKSDFYEKIFIAFQRLHNKNEYSGTGIGLAICKKIIENHNGNIWVESIEEKGSTFYFTISKLY